MNVQPLTWLLRPVKLIEWLPDCGHPIQLPKVGRAMNGNEIQGGSGPARATGYGGEFPALLGAGTRGWPHLVGSPA